MVRMGGQALAGNAAAHAVVGHNHQTTAPGRRQTLRFIDAGHLGTRPAPPSGTEGGPAGEDMSKEDKEKAARRAEAKGACGSRIFQRT